MVPVTGWSGADIELPPIDSLKAAQVLKDAGLPEKKADAAGRLSRLSLLAARRRLAIKRELYEPDWGRRPASRVVRRIMLLGRWNENSDRDRAIAAEATVVGYDDLREEVAELAVADDPFLARLDDGTIGVVSHVDAFLVLRGELRGDDLEMLREVVREVLLERDPSLELPREDRWRSSLLGRTRSYSSDLRQGLASTLALLGVYGDQTIDGATGCEWAAGIVLEVLERANADESCLLWDSLADVLPLLAEAAPSKFLEAVRAGTTGDPPVLRGMFGDAEGGDALSTESAHSNLLWAMEVCVWSPDHFGLVVDLLARLAEIDPGGRLANRPFESIVAILRPWYPQSSVRPEQRLGAIDGMRDRHGDVAWRLLVALLPEGRGFSTTISEPRFRDWKPSRITITQVEYWNFIDELYDRALADVGLDPGRWLSLLEKIDGIPQHLRAETLARLDEISSGEGLPQQGRDAIWEALREKAARHREFPDAEWVLPRPEVAAIERAAARFQPETPLEHRSWLFKNHRPDIPDVKRRDDLTEYEAALGELRAQAANEIADSVDWCRIRAFAETLETPWPLGVALAHAKRYELEENFLRLLESENKAEATFAAGYVWKRFQDDGWDWIDSNLVGGGVSGVAAALLLLYSGDYPKAWELAESLNETVAQAFWRDFRTHGLGGDFAHVDFVAERLITAGRPGSALDMISLYGHLERLSTERAELAASGLEALLETDDRDDQLPHFSHYDFIELFKALETSDIPRDRLARLEWAYLPVFEFEDPPGALSTMLSRDPAFFVDIVQRIYRPRGPDDDEPVEDTGEEWEPEAEPEAADEDQDAAIALNAYQLLSDWKQVPGLREDGTIDADELVAWVTEAREKLAESGHLRAGDRRIGCVLASALAGADGVRPPATVRDLLEQLKSAKIEEAIRAELFNSRGATTRGAFEGGDQELALAANYAEQAKNVAGRWPRTAALLHELSAGWEREARWHDEIAERRRTGFDT